MTVIQFDLFPLETDNAVGLSAANEMAPNFSRGQGNEVGGGIYYDDVSQSLTVTVAYGSAFGFTDLYGNLTAVHIHGPADVNGTAGVRYDLAVLHTAAGPSSGLINGSLGLSAAQGAELLAGLNYLNIHSGAFPGGELRAQLIPVPEPRAYALAAGLGLLAFGAWRRRTARLA